MITPPFDRCASSLIGACLYLVVVANFGVLAYIAMLFRENSAPQPKKSVKISGGDAKAMMPSSRTEPSELGGFGEASRVKTIMKTKDETTVVLEQRQLGEVAPPRKNDVNASSLTTERKKDVIASIRPKTLAALPTMSTARPLPRPWHQLYIDWHHWVQLGTPHGDAWRSPAVARGSEVFHLPYFIIGGAQKAGTTFLRWLLVQHPLLESGDGLHGEARGEPHFFDWGYPSSAASTTLAVATKYSRSFHLAEREFDSRNRSTLFFDTTPAYMVETDSERTSVPGRLQALLPNIKLIFIVREPTDRYRSELQMEICRARLGKISGQFHVHGKMTNYLESEAPAGSGEEFGRIAAIKKPLRRGLYVHQFERWLKFYPRRKMLVVTSEILYATPKQATEDVLAFLFRGVDHRVAGHQDFKFNFKAPKNAACKKDMKPYIDAEELAQLRAFYLKRNRGLPSLLGMEFPWLETGGQT